MATKDQIEKAWNSTKAIRGKEDGVHPSQDAPGFYISLTQKGLAHLAGLNRT